MTSAGLAMLPSTAVAMMLAVPCEPPAVTRPVAESCFVLIKRGGESEREGRK